MTAWGFFTDLGLIAGLLLLGTIIRAKVSLIQRLFLPASIIAGIIGLAFGPSGFNLIPFSDQIGTYPGVLIAVVFGALPLVSPKINWKEISKRVGGMWAYSQAAMVLMWGGGLLFSLLVLNSIWGDLHNGFGLILAAGFVGGHGTAAAIGATFAQQGWEDATSLAMTSATVGILSAILIGLVFIKRGASKGHTNFIGNFDDLPKELQTGLVPKHLRKNIQTDTVSSISIDPYIFHGSIIAVVAMTGYYISSWIASLLPNLAIPAFSVAFLVGLAFKKVLSASKADHYVSKDVINRISGSATDLLVAFGIASISLPVVLEYIVPLSILFAFGLFFAWTFFYVLSRRFFDQHWFEKGIFTWGWTTGTVAMGIALLRIVDPELESNTLDDFGMAYIPIAPVEILIVTFAPLLIVNSQSWLFVGITLTFGLAIFIIAKMNGWFTFKRVPLTVTKTNVKIP
ncbi:sodium/glutamate symporter [Planomicrobium sp. CPCC 101079]|uniref:sodium/glutamate symporter n=1 Tax=Planomicrobium sp. CPCC 101079 TaxID=2599618 RepID=UPI0011B3F59C|nr:sodium/glutamate symporter [Planomicrobium sp. CPCC 101079]TWT14318.1 sodium:glutamate symporter [Planomicrobium sp. CPCC 101079]